MSSISILAGDFEILLDDENNQNGGTLAAAGMRTIQKAVATPTIVTTQTLYSAVAEAMDDFIAMGFRNGMLPTTPNAYTLPNQYFIPRSTTEFLKEGAITADYTLTSSPDTNGNGVLKIPYSVGGGSDFVSTDIGRQVIKVTGTDAGDTGTLLDYDTDPDGQKVAWVRPDDSGADLFDDGTTGTINVSSDGGTGNVDVDAAGAGGETEYAAIQAIGSVPTATEVYIYQDRQRIASSDASFQWWATDPSLSLGIISILIQTKSAGTTIADGDVEVFARRYSALYDNFRLNVAAGGFSALPLASAPDINNTTGYRRNVMTGSSGTWTVGNALYVGATYATATMRGVITAESGGTIEYYLVGDLTDLTGSEAIKEYDFVTEADGDATATGAVGGSIANLLGPTDSTAGEGGTVTVALGGFLVDHDGDGNDEPYSVQVNCQTDVSIASVYERIKYLCSRGQITDLFTGCNIPGESYRGLDGFVEYDNPSGTLVESDDIVTTTGGNTWTARLLHQNTTNSPTYITVADQQTSVDSLVDNNDIQDEALDTDLVKVRSDGSIGVVNFTSPKASPFGTFTGTQIFGARGVSFIGIDTNPTGYILTDDLGTLNNPPTTVTFTVTNTASLDRVLVARDNGTDGIIDKDKFAGMDTPATTYNGEGDQEVRVAGTGASGIDVETPQTGVVRVVENALQEEHRYVYSSRTTGDNGVFTLLTAASFTGTADDTGGTTSPTLLNDDGQAFDTDGVLPGMLMQDTTNGDFYEIVSVDSASQCTIVQIFGTGGTFAAGDAYEINRLIQDYDTGDDLYDLILDEEATTTSVSNTFTKTPAADFDVVVNVRQGKSILPFTLNQLQEDGNTTVTVVRQPDTIAV